MGPKGLFGGAFLLVSSLFFLVGAYWLVDANLIAMNGVRTTGQIAGYEGSARRHVLVYSFVDRKGRRFTGRLTPYSSKSRRLRHARAKAALDVGGPIPVIYDPANPHRSVADTFKGRFGALLWMLFVTPFMAIGIVLIRRDRREQIADGWALRRF
jgi:hypothetical protein